MMKMPEAVIGFFESGRFRRIAASFFVVAAVFAYLLMVSWQKWGDLVVDTSREMWVPLQILQEKSLYRDIYYFHGPLPAYTLALLYTIFGVSINTLIGSGIVITILMCLCMYKLSRMFIDGIASIVLVANFCFVFAFGVGTYDGIFNYILPYSFASTICMMFITASLFFFLKYIESEKTVHLIYWMILLTLSSLARPETAFSVWIVFAISGLLLKSRNYTTRLFVLMLPIVLSAAVYCIVLYKINAFEGFRETLIGSVLFAAKGNDLFVLDSAGLRAVADGVLQIIQSFFYHLTVVGALCCGSMCIAKSFSVKNRKLLYTILGTTIIVAALVFACRFLESPDDLLQYRCIPLVLLCSMLFAMVKMLRNINYKYNHKLFTISIVALLQVSKIMFNSTPILYGFYLLNIGLIGYYCCFINLTSVINRRFFPSNIGKFQYVPILIAFISLFMTSWSVSAHIYEDKNLKIDSGKGIIYCWNDERTTVYWDAVQYLKKNTLENESLVVIPEGASINFYSGRVNPLKYFLFLPGDIEKIGERILIDELLHNRIKYIALVHRPSEEYGSSAFGRDYGLKLSAWIYENYKPVKQFGVTPFTSDQFGILILQRAN